MEAFQSISIKKPTQDKPTFQEELCNKTQHHPSVSYSQCDMDGGSSSSSLQQSKVIPILSPPSSSCLEVPRMDSYIPDDDDDDSDVDDLTFLSDREEAERQAMYNLVYGRRPLNPVDARVDEWIRDEFSRRRQEAVTARTAAETTLDDMHLDHTAVYQNYATGSGMFRTSSFSPMGRQQRSNSLPSSTSGSFLTETDEDAAMDTS
jgi:hypothetical protein